MSKECGDKPDDVAFATAVGNMQRVISSEGISAEYGIRALKGPFEMLRLLLLLTPNSHQANKLLCTCARMLNLWTGIVGPN